jgi:hypothetical protein
MSCFFILQEQNPNRWCHVWCLYDVNLLCGPITWRHVLIRVSIESNLALIWIQLGPNMTLPNLYITCLIICDYVICMFGKTTIQLHTFPLVYCICICFVASTTSFHHYFSLTTSFHHYFSLSFIGHVYLCEEYCSTWIVLLLWHHTFVLHHEPWFGKIK